MSRPKYIDLFIDTCSASWEVENIQKCYWFANLGKLFVMKYLDDIAYRKMNKKSLKCFVD